MKKFFKKFFNLYAFKQSENSINNLIEKYSKLKHDLETGKISIQEFNRQKENLIK